MSEYALEQPPEPPEQDSGPVGDRPGRARYRAGVSSLHKARRREGAGEPEVVPHVHALCPETLRAGGILYFA